MKKNQIEVQHLNAGDFRQSPFEKVILPLGSLESHGAHLPFGTDALTAYIIALDIAARLPKTAVLPPVNYGVSKHYKDFSFTVTVGFETQIMVIRDILESVYREGVRKVFIMNGHDGNIAPIEVASRSDLGGDAVQEHHVARGHRDVLGEAAVAVHPDDRGALAHVPVAGTALQAVAADDVALGRHQLALLEVLVDVAPHFDDLAGELVPDREGRLAPSLGPRVPVGDVEVGAAHARVVHADQDVGLATGRLGHVAHDESRPRRRLDDRFHGSSESRKSLDDTAEVATVHGKNCAGNIGRALRRQERHR